MRKIIILITILISSSYSFSQGIVFFDGSFDKAKELAKTQNKIIFIDCYTSWCGPCKWMAKNVFTDSVVGAFYNANFINYKLDMEKGEGKIAKKDYKINGYPTLLYINGDGEIEHRSLGGSDTAEFIKIGKKALDTNNNYGNLLRKYKSGNRNPEFLSEYALSCANLSIPYDINEYFKTQADTELFKEINLILIEWYIVNNNMREFKFLANNIEKFSQLYGKQRIENRVVTIITKSLWHLALQKDPIPLPKAINKIIEPFHFKDSVKIFYKVEMQYYITSKELNWQKYAIIANEYIKTIGIEQIDLSEIYQITNNISKNVSDSIYLKKGIEWCDYLTSKKFQIPEVTLVKARIYKKLGNNIKANEFAQFALTEEKKKTSPRIKEYQNFINELEKQTKKQ